MPATEFQLGSYTLSVKQRLAEGGFGFVDLVMDMNTRQEYVCKRCGVQRQQILEVVKKEISILQRFAGPYVVKLLASDIVTQRAIKEAVLLLEYCPGGHLLERLNNRAGAYLPAPNVYRIFGQLLLGIQSLHESDPPITHRDLKLENILFGTDGNVKLCDFGSCVYGHVPLRNVDERNAAEEIIQKETTQMYRAPEMIDLYMRELLTERTDIWALGCIFYALCFLTHPFQDAGSLGILNAKINMPESAPVAPEARTLILRMLDIDPEARPSVQQLLEAFTALATGHPLPTYELSEDALRHRQEREAIAAKRDARNRSAAAKKVATPVVPKKAPAPLASNSVAAKRLAAKRGGGGVGDATEGEIDFDQAGTGAANYSSSAPAGDDIWGAPSVASTASQSLHTSGDFSFDAFGASAAPSATQDDLVSFDSPDKSSSQSKSSGGFGGGGFDPFASSAPIRAPSGDLLDTEDGFGGDPFGTTAPAHTAVATSGTAQSSFGIDDDFSQLSLNAPNAAPAAAAPRGFDDFFSGGGAKSPGSNRAVNANTNTNHTFDAFSSPGSPSRGGGSADVFDAFSTQSTVLKPTTSASSVGSDFFSSPPLQAHVSTSPQRADNVFSSVPQTAAAATSHAATRVLDLFDSSNEPEREKDIDLLQPSFMSTVPAPRSQSLLQHHSAPSSSSSSQAGVLSLLQPQGSSQSGLLSLGGNSSSPSTPSTGLSPHREGNSSVLQGHQHKDIKDVLSLFDQPAAGAGGGSGSSNGGPMSTMGAMGSTGPMRGIGGMPGMSMSQGQTGMPGMGMNMSQGQRGMGMNMGNSMQGMGMGSSAGMPLHSMPGPFPGQQMGGGGVAAGMGGLGSMGPGSGSSMSMGSGGMMHHGVSGGAMGGGATGIMQSQSQLQSQMPMFRQQGAGQIGGGAFPPGPQGSLSLSGQGQSMSMPPIPPAASKPTTADPFASLNMLATKK